MIALITPLTLTRFRRFREIAKGDYHLRDVRLSIHHSVRMGQLGFHYTDFHRILNLTTFRKSVEKIHINWNMTRITGTLHERKYIYFVISRSVLLRMRNVLDKICRKPRNTRFMFDIFFLNLTSCEIMWKNIAKPERSQVIIWRMRIARWIRNFINTLP